MLDSADELAQDLNGAPERCVPRFFMGTKPNAKRSEEEGRHVVDDVEKVEIIIPGERDTVVKVVDDALRRRFARHYAAFKQGQQTATLSGTPLADWAGVTRGQVEELASLRIHTVEDLSNTSDVNGQRIPGFHALKQKAQAFLASAKDGAQTQKMAAQLLERDSQIEALRKQLADLSEKVEAQGRARK